MECRCYLKVHFIVPTPIKVHNLTANWTCRALFIDRLVKMEDVFALYCEFVVERLLLSSAKSISSTMSRASCRISERGFRDLGIPKKSWGSSCIAASWEFSEWLHLRLIGSWAVEMAVMVRNEGASFLDMLMTCCGGVVGLLFGLVVLLSSCPSQVSNSMSSREFRS